MAEGRWELVLFDGLSAHERRRRAPLHYEVKADNARFAAFVLWENGDKGRLKATAKRASYGGNPRISLGEAFRREAAIAIELMIKAVIAQLIEIGKAKPHVVKVRPTHDLVSLWADAELPALSAEDQYSLLLARRVLYWSGRYAAPIKDEHYEQEEEALAKIVVPRREGAPGTRWILFNDWETFDRIYTTASTRFWETRNAHY
jgi:hypothetical protein